MVLEPLVGSSVPFITLFPVILVATVIGGIVPGLIATIVGLIATWYVVIGTPFEFELLSIGEITEFALFLVSAILMVLVASAMRGALERLETAQERLYAALQASHTGTWRWDIQRDLIEWDPAMLSVFGLDAAQVPRNLTDVLNLVHPDDRDYVSRVTDMAIKNRATAEHEFRTILPDGTEHWIYDRSRIFSDPEGRPAYMIGASLDITDRKHAEERQLLLLHELNHRVKNTLATVQSLAQQTLRRSVNPGAFQTNFIARLMALSATHDILTRKLWEGASIDEILGAELQPYGGIDQNRIRAAGEAVQLKPQQALSLGMVFHELATNAAKYGSLSTPRGSVRVSWTVTQPEPGENRLTIRWLEQGGPVVRKPEHRGFGTRLIERSIAHELGGQVQMDFVPSGLDCLLQIPLTNP
ncbi:sensor histidine kinase [Microvirga sp. 2TAF3]